MIQLVIVNSACSLLYQFGLCFVVVVVAVVVVVVWLSFSFYLKQSSRFL